MRGKLKFWIQTRDPNVLHDAPVEVLKSYPHLNTVLVSAFEEDIVRLALELGQKIDHISKSIPFRTVGV
jgi:hypothetical protein